MKDKKNKFIIQTFKLTFIVIFAIFITIFMSNKNGYYEHKRYEQASLTQEQIKKFEQDIKDGKNVNLQDYITNSNNNYQTKLSQAGLNISNSIANVVKKGVDNLFKKIGDLTSNT